MNVQIRNAFEMVLGGARARHEPAKSYGEEILDLLGVVWAKVRKHSAEQDGINVVVYDPDGTIFAGVEMPADEAARCGLSSKKVRLARHGYFKHVGSYNLLFQACADMAKELSRMGHEPIQPVVEIYGHWTEDESKLETEILYSISE